MLIFILSIPDDPSDIYKIPEIVVDELKRVIFDDTYASGKDFSMFTYDDGSMIFYRYVKENIRPSHIKVYTEREVSCLKDVMTGNTIDVSTITVWENWQKKKRYVADLILTPGVFRRFKWE